MTDIVHRLCDAAFELEGAGEKETEYSSLMYEAAGVISRWREHERVNSCEEE